MIADNDFLSSLKQVELCLRPAFFSGRVGIHALSHHGRSLEFAGYQEYSPGDDLKELDWKLFARSDRYYIKQRDTHTFAKTLIILDDSSSMDYCSEGASVSKFRGGLLLAFGLGYLLYKQGDAFSFQKLSTTEPPQKARSSKKAFHHLVEQLQNLEKQGPSGNKHQLNQGLRPDTIDHVFFISDFLVQSDHCKQWFKMMKLIGRECSCFHIIDPGEETPSSHPEIRDLENRKSYRTLSTEEWAQYRANFKTHQNSVRQSCLEQRFSYQVLSTKGSIEETIRKVLSSKK